jgi:hypothetical protein
VNRVFTSVFTLIVTLAPGITGANAQHPKQPCFKIGDTVTIRGHIVPGVNGGTYFQLSDPSPCISGSAGDVVVLGEKLPSNVYLEVKGQLQDVYPIVSIGIRPTSFRNIDEEVRAKLGEEKLSCIKWQDAHILLLNERAHGASVVRDPQNSGDDYEHDCAIWSVDKQLPHKTIALRRTGHARAYRVKP